MTSETDIRGFIEQQRQAGAFDSSGHFSLDLRKAREKYELLHQNMAGAHALLWVQATNYLQPQQVRLTFDSVEMNGEVPFAWEEFRDIALGNGPLPSRQRALRQAIRACSALAQFPPQVTYRHQKHGHFHLNLRSGTVEQVPEDPLIQMLPQAPCDMIRVSFPRQGTGTQHADELRQLQAGCGFSPSQPRYDNRFLTKENHEGYRGRPLQRTDWNCYTHSSYLLAVRQTGVAPGHVGVLTPSQNDLLSQIPGQDQDHSVFLLERDPLCDSGRAERMLAIPIGLEGPGSLRLIYRGVLIEDLEVDLGVAGAWVVACADHLQTDLSGLKLVHDEGLERLVHEVRQQTIQLAQHARAQLDSFQLPRFCAPQPGLLARLTQWAFPSKEAPAVRDCRAEIQRRLDGLGPSLTKGRAWPLENLAG